MALQRINLLLQVADALLQNTAIALQLGFTRSSSADTTPGIL
jgi:hypothetical protein